MEDITRTLCELSIVRAFLTFPDPTVAVPKVVSTSVCVVSNPPHALWKTVVILSISVRRQNPTIEGTNLVELCPTSHECQEDVMRLGRDQEVCHNLCL